MAQHALMSPRTFTPPVREETGPDAVLLAPRPPVDKAGSSPLPCSTLDINEIAAKVGFGSGTVLRHHFGRIRGTSPLAYRRTLLLRERKRTAPTPA